MKKVILAVCSLGFATAVYANCTSSTITTPNGKMMFCQTCCYGPNNCHTQCF